MKAESIAILLAVAVTAACASTGQGGDAGPRKNRNVITRAELVENNFYTAHEAVASLRSNWLQTRGTDSFRTPSKVWVYLDSNKLGGVETLTAIAVNSVSYIQHFNGNEATTWWGVGHNAGVIYVSTHPVVTENSLR